MTKHDDNTPVQTKIENGTIEGFHDAGKDLHIYLGLPFAQPPVGRLRWQAPQPVEDWDGVLETKTFGPRPVQPDVFDDMNFRSPRMSEDCLYLNVWTPVRPRSQTLPVLVYFYGGGFVAGDGSEPRYDGASMASQGMVAVTVNYRLNVFGFLAHPELTAEAPYEASGNYGLLDQNAALQWVRRNIAAFGGDPQKITIAGESAGSVSVSAQMGSPLSRDLIAGAIGESGAAINPTLFPIPLAHAEKEGLSFAQEAGRPALTDLRALSAEELLGLYSKSGRFGFPMALDGYFFPKTLVEIFSAGEQAQVPLLLGWNSAETQGTDFMQDLPYTQENYVKRVKEDYASDYEEVLRLYPFGSERQIEASATALASDWFIAYSTWKWFDLHRKHSAQPVYRYLYSKIRPPLVDQSRGSGQATVEKEDDVERPKPLGAVHACEIEYCLGNLSLVKDYAWTQEDFQVSTVMPGFFANFILTGNPNGDHLLQWPAAQADDPKPPVMIIDVTSRAEDAQYDERYLFLDKANGNAGVPR